MTHSMFEVQIIIVGIFNHYIIQLIIILLFQIYFCSSVWDTNFKLV